MEEPTSHESLCQLLTGMACLALACRGTQCPSREVSSSFCYTEDTILEKLAGGVSFKQASLWRVNMVTAVFCKPATKNQITSQAPGRRGPSERGDKLLSLEREFQGRSQPHCAPPFRQPGASPS